jgi:hypothetical protein
MHSALTAIELNSITIENEAEMRNNKGEMKISILKRKGVRDVK